MKVFISHSWKDKSIATNLFELLRLDGHEVWYDVHQLIPGDNIQQVIDTNIGQCDAMLLLWSKYAAVSDGVDAEIKTAKMLGKRIIPILSDDTALDGHDMLKGTLGIPLEPWETGSLLIRRALLLLSLSEADKKTDWYKDIFGNITELGGYLNYINTYRLTEQLNEDGDKEKWADRMEALAEDNEKIRKEVLPEMQQTMAELQNIMEQLEHGSVSPKQLEDWMQWCHDKKSFHPDLMEKLETFLTREKERLNAGGTAVATVSYTGLLQTADALEAAILATKDQAYHKMSAKIKKYGGFLLGEKTIDNMVTGYLNYVVMGPTLLRQLVEEARQSEFVAVKESLSAVENFLNQKDRSTIAEHAILEHYFDDAYIINNSVQILMDTGLVKKEKFSYDNIAVGVVNTYVSFVIEQKEKSRLDTVLQQLKTMVGAKKDEINWKQVALGVAGAIAVFGGLAALTDGDVGDAGIDGAAGGSFEDKMARINAEMGGGLSDNFYK